VDRELLYIHKIILSTTITTSSSSGGSQLTVYIVVHHQDNALNATVPAAVGTVPLAEAF